MYLHNREVAEVHHVPILTVSLVIQPKNRATRVLFETSVATLVGSPYNSRTRDEVKVKCGIGSMMEGSL